MQVFRFIGTKSPDYRGIKACGQDFEAGGKKIPIHRLVIAEQTHSAHVHVCSREDCGAGIGDKAQIPVADGLITDIPDQYLLIRTADCTPILIWDESVPVVCALHSGRESTRLNIAKAAISLLKERWNCQPQNLKAIIGPGISEAHYEVSPAIYETFLSSFLQDGLEASSHHYRHLDIPGSIRLQLLACEIPEANIRLISDCTFENHDYFSFRREGTYNRQINLIGIEP